MGQRQGTILKKCPCANQECCSHKWTLRYWADGIAQRLYHVIVEDLEEGASALRG